jgi:hypothetical protein
MLSTAVARTAPSEERDDTLFYPRPCYRTSEQFPRARAELGTPGGESWI